jgi:hypothetical protein
MKIGTGRVLDQKIAQKSEFLNSLNFMVLGYPWKNFRKNFA